MIARPHPLVYFAITICRLSVQHKDCFRSFFFFRNIYSDFLCTTEFSVQIKKKEKEREKKREKERIHRKKDNRDMPYLHVREKKIEDLSVERVCRMVSQQRSDFRGRPRKTNPVIFQTVFPSGLHGTSCKALRKSIVSIFQCEET